MQTFNRRTVGAAFSRRTVGAGSPRSGMILMLMLALMSLFAALIVGFMVVSSMANRTAAIAAKIGRSQDINSQATANEDAKQAIRTLLVGSDNPNCVIGPHSILENLYGHPGTGSSDQLWGDVVAPTAVATPPSPIVGTPLPINGTQRLYFDFRYPATWTFEDFMHQMSIAGNVLTFGDDPSLQASQYYYSLRIVDWGYDTNDFWFDVIEAENMPVVGDEFYVNAAPFSGDGIGAAYLNAPNPTAPYNSAGTWKQDYLLNLNGRRIFMNPDHTAPNLQNMFLSWYDAQIPSFHRENLFTSPTIRTSALPGDPKLLPTAADVTNYRKMSLRPLQDDHPDFTGSNPAYDELGPNWDIDNDRDGDPDSIWTYTGMPVKTLKNGTTVIPLVAYLVRDLDGRVNLNTAGNLIVPTAPASAMDNDGAGAPVVYGSGAGTAEIDIAAAFPAAATQTEIVALMKARYGNENPITIGGGNVEAAQFFGFPNDGDLIAGGIFGGLAPDLWGISAITHDSLGQRVNFQLNNWVQGTTNWGAVWADNPYLFDPYHKTPYDEPFSVAEFEAMLRPYDRDTNALPERLKTLFFSSTPFDKDAVRDVTTISSDIPSPNRRVGTDAGIYSHIYRWVRNANPTGNITTWQQITESLISRLPIEIRQGLRIDLNRLSKSPNWTNTGNHQNGLQERAEYAQGIYILLLAMCQDHLAVGFAEAPLTSAELIKTRLAQWAINLVDFADPDAVMTPMLFDIDPFNGWDTDADLIMNTTNSTAIETALKAALPSDGIRLVWGMERPDLLLTETFATHNRGVADTAMDGGGKGQIGTSSPNTDTNFDQVAPPQGSAFFELYCTANQNQPYFPTELYTGTNLDLTKLDDSGNYPVWRIAIGASTYSNTAYTEIKNSAADRMSDADFTFQPQQNTADTLGRSNALSYAIDTTKDIALDRIIWFSAAAPEEAAISFTTATPGTLAPNNYAVVAPRNTVTNLGSVENTTATPAGFGTPSTVNIPAQPSAIVAISANPAAVAAGLTLGINVSEPLTGYTTQFIVGTTPIADTPYDDAGPLGDDNLTGEGTVPYYKTAFLQRIADPLRNYDAVTNPYITVDWNMIDLTVFRGERSGDALSDITPALAKSNGGENWEKDKDFKFAVSSRQWGRSGMPTGNLPQRPNPWARVLGAGNSGETPTPTYTWDPLNPADATAPTGEESGLENTTATGPTTAAFPYDPTSFHTLGTLNKMYYDSAGKDIVTNPILSPDAQFIHLPFNNSPYSNPYEIMQVPASAPGRFGVEFVDSGGDTVFLNDTASKSMGSGGRFGADVAQPNRIGHLLNFFDSAPNVGGSLNLAQFLEFVHIPSRFVGTQHYLDTISVPPVTVSLYREPGKININTMPESTTAGKSNVLDALIGSRTDPGYTALQSAIGINFETPFKTAAGANDTFDTAAVPAQTEIDPARATLLRPGSTNLLIPWQNNLNTYNELESVQRLSNMTTTRSNCFAVWATIGYFEVEKVDLPTARTKTGNAALTQEEFDAIYPDGYMIGKEYGIDTGETVRHRGFWLLDRTIPVGFRRGMPMNERNVILMERILE